MASFEIVEVTASGETISLSHLGVFPDGKMAASAAQSMLLFSPDKKYQPRPIAVAKDWRKAHSNLPPLPWGDALKPIRDHFARVSSKDSSMVAYFASENSGKLDRLTNVHVNRYLVDFYPDLDVDVRRRLVWKFTGEPPVDVLLFAATADEIEDVYKDGPNSCMSHSTGFYASTEHPTRAYAGPDLQIAYVEGKYGGAVARTVVWPEKKIYATIYGDREKLLPELKRIGYRLGTRPEWEGARLTLISDEGYFDEDETSHDGYACPYIDFATAVEPIDGYLVVSRKGTYDCKYQCGIASQETSRCPHCKERRCSEGFFYISDLDEDDNVCEDCAAPYLKSDALSGGYLHLSDARQISNGRYVSRYHYEYHTFTCPGNGGRYLHEEAVMHHGVRHSEEGLAQLLKAEAA